MAENRPPPDIPEFTVWEDEDGLHAKWLKPLDDVERLAGVCDEAKAFSPDALAVMCAEMRISRDLANRRRHHIWRSPGVIARTALDDIAITTGDLP